MADPTLCQRQLLVSNRGAVSLSGSVIGPEESRKAEGLVFGITGVRSVANDIIVTLPPQGLSHGL
jgi:hypothetical protein